MVSTFAKPERQPRERKGIDRRPKCACGDKATEHAANMAPGSGLVFTITRGLCMRCPCQSYRPSPLRRQPVERKATSPKRKLMPKCKHCAYSYGRHAVAHGLEGVEAPYCKDSTACPGYAPAIGIRQKRRTPAAAVKRIADDLWTRIVHARPGGCEIQQYHPHECSGGFQAMHGIPRTFAATRWLPINGFKGCADIHKYYTHRPEMWALLLAFAWGHEPARELWTTARAMQPVDMDATVASLRSELAAREISE